MKLEAAARCRAQGLKTALSRSWLVVVKTAMWLHTPWIAILFSSEATAQQWVCECAVA